MKERMVYPIIIGFALLLLLNMANDINVLQKEVIELNKENKIQNILLQGLGEINASQTRMIQSQDTLNHILLNKKFIR